jgi:hypothetical protein
VWRFVAGLRQQVRFRRLLPGICVQLLGVCVGERWVAKKQPINLYLRESQEIQQLQQFFSNSFSKSRQTCSNAWTDVDVRRSRGEGCETANTREVRDQYENEKQIENNGNKKNYACTSLSSESMAS